MRTRIALLGALTLWAGACTDSGLVELPQDAPLDLPGPSLAIVDAGNGGEIPGFWFLPPLAKQVTTEGVLDPGLDPAMEVCELDGNPSAVANPSGWDAVSCVDLDPDPETVQRKIVVSFPAGAANLVPGEHYAFAWNTSPGQMDPDKFYRIFITLDGADLGFLDVNPQQPSGQSPGADFDDLYAFRLGENLPVKVFINVQARCATAEGYVIQCTAQGVIDAAGGVVTLEPDQADWAKLSVVVPAGALPAGYPEVILTMERIDPVAFLQETGERCIPGLPFAAGSSFDAPEFGDCLRVTTDPEITVELELAALIEMCIDPFDYADVLKFDEEQDTRLQIVRFEDGVTQGLANVDATTCGAPALPSPSLLGLLPVPDDGLMRLAAIGVNHVARWLGPEPVAAHGDIRLAGSTSEFSRFRWALPGEMVKEVGDNTVIQQQEDGSESYDVPITVKVVDAGSPALSLDPSTVEGATVHFSTASGSVSGADVTTAADGLATVTWTVPSTPGTYTLDAKALGLLSSAVPDHSGAIDFTEATVTFTTTVVGQPSSATQSPPSSPPLSGIPGETLTTPLVFTVLDEHGNPVVGWDVTWTTTCSAADPADCDGYVTGGTQTDASGQASGLWTLATTPGANTATATVGGVTFSFVAGVWTAEGQCQVVVDGTVDVGEWDCAQAAGDVRTFTANISGGDTPAEVAWQSDGENLYFLVRVLQSSLSKANNLRFDFDNDGSGIHNEGDDAIGFDADNGTFFDEYLTKKCANNSQSGCGKTDSVSQDGEGAVGNDGSWTIYELSHPLQGTAGEDFVRATGDDLGFFLTLRVGKGAQGNTQFPDFRDFEIISIR